MNQQAAKPIRSQVDEIYRNESRRVFATLIRLLGDFDLAEEALHEAFTAAVAQWSRDGMPTNPRSWLVSTGRFKAIDTIRRRTRFDSLLPEIAPDSTTNDTTVLDEEDVEDDRLRLIFTCCHPALSPEAQVALTLREVCGLTTEEIASAFLIPPATLAQRIVRAKTKIRTAGIPYQVPSLAELPDRLDTVLQTIYLVFNEGYAASSGASLTRSDLAAEAIRLERLVVELLPDAEANLQRRGCANGLLALMLLQESRRTARTSSTGDIILLEDQDRSLWNQSQIAEGRLLVTRSLSSPEVGSYTLQAAIAAVHSEAASAAETDWAQVVALYDLLMQAEPTPIVELNRSVAVAMRDGFAVGLQSIDNILARGDLADYHLAHAARADFCRRLGRIDDARASYQQALALVKQEPERRFLEKRLRELG
jgi:RNA polymerase sigma-70 factor, ECF subfamily